MHRDLVRCLILVAALLATGGAVTGAVATASVTGADAVAGDGPPASVPGGTEGKTGAGTATARTNASVVAVYPNPVAADDAGEFVVVAVPPGTHLGALAIGDGEARVPLPNVTAGGRVTLSTHPNRTRQLLDRRVYPLSDRIRLANSGERVRLYRGGTTLDSLAYERAPAGDVRVRDRNRPWRALGATDREVVTAAGGRVTAYVLPDAPGMAVDVLRSADERILLAAYTLTSERVADALVAAARRDVDVRVLVEAALSVE